MVTASFDDLPGIGLGELVARADLQTRTDRKYLVPDDAVPELFAGVAARVLRIDDTDCFRYESVYFDTPGRASHRAAAQGRPRRFKVRVRTYLDTGECRLELKVRDRRGRTVKHRFPCPPATRNALDAGAGRVLGAFDEVAPHLDALGPTVTVGYRRTTLLLDGGDVRVTVDRATTWSGPGACPLTMGGLTLVETKSPGAPSSLERSLWRAGHRPVRFSKFCVGGAVLDPGLPANRWHRILRRHVFPAVLPAVLPTPRTPCLSVLAPARTRSTDWIPS